MSFRNRLFQTNLKVAIIPMAAFLIVVLGLLGWYRHAFSDSDTELYLKETDKVVILLEKTEPGLLMQEEGQKQLDQELRRNGYSLAVLRNQDIIYSNVSDLQQESMKASMASEQIDVPVIWMGHRRCRVSLQKRYEENIITMIAVSSQNHLMEQFTENDAFYIMIIVSILLLLFFIFLLCRNYSRRMTKHLMAPILRLGEGATRIQQGNLNVMLDYEVEDEFRPVFDSFNEMQLRLKENIFQRIEREKKQQEMIAEISHDLKTPLTSIKGYVKGITDGVANTPEKQKHYLSKIEKKTDDMTHLIEEILMYSRLERQKIEFHMEVCLIDSYLQEIIAAMEDDDSRKSVQFSYGPHAEGIKVQIDPLQLNRVVENIVENSRKYSGQKQTCMEITTQKKEHEVCIFLKDSGVGVPEDRLSQIFETFYRVDDARNNPTEGSGLGLAIVKHIVEKMSGTVMARNENGLCIIITLPVYEEGLDE